MDIDSLKHFNKYLEFVSLVITGLITLFVLIKLRFRLDKAAYVIVVISLLSLTIRVF